MRRTILLNPAFLIRVQMIGSGVFPIVSFPPSALSVGDAEFLSSFRNRVSFIAFYVGAILAQFFLMCKFFFKIYAKIFSKFLVVSSSSSAIIEEVF